MQLTWEILNEYKEKKLIIINKHPDGELFIVNYTPNVQYEKLWDEITLQARGLIIDNKGNVIAKPFRKFFNLEEHKPDEIPQLPFEVYEKLDGSLGILYFLNDKPYIATRGSFESDQAKRANKILLNKYEHTFSKLEKTKTYLFEIIYPENRIVVDYNGLDDLILLSIIDNNTGHEEIKDIGFPMVKRYDGINDIYRLKTLEQENKEGFVIRFQNGLRVKMKFSEYVRLHRIITGVSNVLIWEYLKNDKPFGELLEKVPDEFYDWVNDTVTDLKNKYNVIFENAVNQYNEYYTPDRKIFALNILEKCPKISSILFKMFDQTNFDHIIWNMIRPKFTKPFMDGM